MGDYDKIASYYDLMARIVFANRIRVIQNCFIDTIKVGSRILIYGGGTGWQLQQILKTQPNIEIYYVEQSRRMIKLAKRRLTFQELKKVRFLTNDEDLDKEFDVVICAFFLDLFDSDVLNNWVVPRIKSRLSSSAIILCYDFQLSGNWFQLLWKKSLMTIMILFFKLSTGLKIKSLAPIENILSSHGLNLDHKLGVYGNFIWAGNFSYEASRD